MHRMREATYFLDPPAYYSQPGAGQSVVVSAGGAQGGSQGGTKGASFPSNRLVKKGREGGVVGGQLQLVVGPEPLLLSIRCRGLVGRLASPPTAYPAPHPQE